MEASGPTNLDKYRCKHGILGACNHCWAEGFRERRLNNPRYREQVELLRQEEKEKSMTRIPNGLAPNPAED